MRKLLKDGILSGPFVKVGVVGAAIAVIATALVVGYFSVRHYRRVSRINEAEQLIAAGDYDKAEVVLRYCVLADRDNEKLVVRFAELLEMQKRWRDASEVWNMAASLNPYNNDYRIKALRTLAIGREYRRVLALAGAMPIALVNRPEVLELCSLAELRVGSQKKAQDMFLTLSKEGAAKSPLAELLLFIFCEEPKDTPETREKLDAFAASSDGAVACEAMLMLAKLDIDSGDFAKAETVFEKIGENNPEVGLPILGDFYFDRGDFAAAAAVYKKAMEYGLTLKSAVNYGESLAYIKDVAGIEKLAGFFRTGGRAAMMTGYYFDALVAYLNGDDAKVDDFVSRIDESFDSALAVMIQLSSYVRQENVTQVVRLIRTIRGLPRLNYLYPYAYDLVLPLVVHLYDQVKISQLASLSRVLVSPGAPNLLLTRALLLDEMNSGTVDRLDMQNALRDFPNDPTVLDVGAMQAMQSGDFAGMFNLTVRNLDNGNRTPAVVLLQIIALEELGRIDEADHEFQRLLTDFPEDSGTVKNYLAFCVRHTRAAGLDFLLKVIGNAKNSDIVRLKPLVAAEVAMLNGDHKAAIDGVRQTLAADFLDEHKSADVELLFRMAGILGSAGEIPDAVKLYRRLKPVYDDPELIGLNLSELLAAAGDHQAALDEAENVWKTDDSDIARQVFGLRLYESGKYEMAERVLDKLLNGNADERVSNAWVESVEALIKQSFAAGKYGECREYCGKLYKRFPENQVALDYADKAVLKGGSGVK